MEAGSPNATLTDEAAAVDRVLHGVVGRIVVRTGRAWSARIGGKEADRSKNAALRAA